MSTEDKMNIDEKRKYLRTMQKRYVKADKRTKGELLDEMEAVTGLNRKTLIRLMATSLERTPRSRERGNSYGPEVDRALRVIYESADGICAERLTSNLVWWAEHLAAHGELELTPELREQLSHLSDSTVARRLAELQQDWPRLPHPVQPKPGRRYPAHIPMLCPPRDISEPGHFEVDLVHHYGPTAAGEYAYTLDVQ
ncbi:MAG: hypothetical protein N2508_13715 [Anaerolineae bacterium]|nr:hypothetical protein [Anaerolineae bacterium]